MKEELKLGEEELIEAATKEKSITSDDVAKSLKKDKPKIKNEVPENYVDIEEMSNIGKVTEEEMNNVFDRLNGVVFKIDKCMFRICYLNKGQKRFTAELLNGE